MSACRELSGLFSLGPCRVWPLGVQSSASFPCLAPNEMCTGAEPVAQTEVGRPGSRKVGRLFPGTFTLSSCKCCGARKDQLSDLGQVMLPLRTSVSRRSLCGSRGLRGHHAFWPNLDMLGSIVRKGGWGGLGGLEGAVNEGAGRRFNWLPGRNSTLSARISSLRSFPLGSCPPGWSPDRPELPLGALLPWLSGAPREACAESKSSLQGG